jgi:AcrR family transcriptional regulator
MILFSYHRRMREARARGKAARIRAYQEAIVEAAERLFARQGVDATKMEGIAHEAGLSLRTVYSTLDGGKAELVDAIRSSRLTELVRFAVEAAESSAPPVDKLRSAWEKATDFFMAHPDYLKMHMREGYAWGLPAVVSARSRADAVSFREGVGAISAIVEEGRDQGVFSVDRPERSAQSIVTLQQVHLAEWLDDGEKDSSEVVFDRFWADVKRLLNV